MVKIGFLYEHPTWSDDLIACFSQNQIDLELIKIDEAAFDTGGEGPDFDLLVNRVNIMPSEGCDSTVTFHTLHYLGWAEARGVRVINGARAHHVGSSKAIQNGIFAKLGLDHPRAVAIHRIADVLPAAEQIGYPLITKPNIGGSGNGVARFDTPDELARALREGTIDLGIDGSGLVQEYVSSDGYVYRVEVLGGELFYSIRQQIIENQFNYCAADGCSIAGPDEAPATDQDFDFCVLNAPGGIEVFDVPDAVVAHVADICRAADADVGGVEYFIRSDTGSPCFYDFNPYSNFVSDGENLLGFSPEQRFVDFVKQQLK